MSRLTFADFLQPRNDFPQANLWSGQSESDVLWNLSIHSICFLYIHSHSMSCIVSILSILIFLNSIKYQHRGDRSPQVPTELEVSIVVQFWDSMGKAAYSNRVCLKLGDLFQWTCETSYTNHDTPAWSRLFLSSFQRNPHRWLGHEENQALWTWRNCHVSCKCCHVKRCSLSDQNRRDLLLGMIAICGASDCLNHSVLGTHAVVRVVPAILRLSGLSGPMTVKHWHLWSYCHCRRIFELIEGWINHAFPQQWWLSEEQCFKQCPNRVMNDKWLKTWWL